MSDSETDFMYDDNEVFIDNRRYRFFIISMKFEFALNERENEWKRITII